MKILTRYLLRSSLVPFMFALTALTSIMLLNQIAKRFGALVGKGLPWTVIAEVFALSIPFILAMTIPMAVLVTVLYTFTRLGGDREITAMKAAGVSVRQIMTPVLLASFLVAAVAFLFSDQVLPRTNHRLRTLITDIDRTKPTLVIEEQVINEVQNNKMFLRSARIDPASFRMIDVTIFDLDNQDRKRIIYADSGEMNFAANQEDLLVTLYDGVIHEFDRTQPALLQRIGFDKNLVVVPEVGRQLRRTENDSYRGDREMSTCSLDSVVRHADLDAARARSRAEAARSNALRELVGLRPVQADTTATLRPEGWYCRALKRATTLVQPLAAQEINIPQTQEEGPRLGELQTIATRQRQATTRANIYAVEFHKKYAIAAACIVFVIVGIPIALMFPRGGVGFVIALSVVVFSIYYFGLIGGETLANSGLVSPALSMWITNIVFTVIGVVLLMRIRTSAVPASRISVVRRVLG